MTTIISHTGTVKPRAADAVAPLTLRCVQVCLQIIGLQCLHLLVLCLRHHAAVCGDSDQQLLLWGLIRGPEDRDRGVDDRFIHFFPNETTGRFTNFCGVWYDAPGGDACEPCDIRTVFERKSPAKRDDPGIAGAAAAGYFCGGE